MGRKKLIRTSKGAYHITSRVNHKTQFPLPLEECWPIFLGLLQRITEKYLAEIHAFVLMSNHYHLLISTPKMNIDSAMRYFNREATRSLSTQSGLVNHIFGARYQWNIVYDSFAFGHVLKYIYRNPVKAGVCQRVEDYPFSTVHYFRDPWIFPFIRESSIIPKANKSVEEIFRWLNTPLPSEQQELIRRAIKRKEFQFGNHPATKKIVAKLEFPPW